MKRIRTCWKWLVSLGLLAGVLVGLGWWVRREPEPKTAMESVISFWDGWSDDVVKERARAYVSGRQDPSPSEMLGAAEALGGSYAVGLCEKAVQKAPQDPPIRFGLIGKLCSSAEEVQEVILASYRPGSSWGPADPVQQNLTDIQTELAETRQVDPTNACLDYLQAYLLLVYQGGTTEQFLALLDEAAAKPAFQDYSLQTGRIFAEFLIRAGFPERESKFAVIQGAENSFRGIWAKMTARLEALGTRLVADGDKAAGERVFAHMVQFGERLSNMGCWMDENLSGLNAQAIGLKALGDLYASQDRSEEAKAYQERERDVRKHLARLQPYSRRGFGGDFEDHHHGHGGGGGHRLRSLGAQEFSEYLDTYLTQGAQEALNILSSRG